MYLWPSRPDVGVEIDAVRGRRDVAGADGEIAEPLARLPFRRIGGEQRIEPGEDVVVLVGGSRENTRIGHVLYKRISQARMADALVGLFRAVREHNTEGLPVGEFLHRSDPAVLRGWIGIEDEAKD